jgi:crotonobetaine/carnitine-CoA ligase
MTEMAYSGDWVLSSIVSDRAERGGDRIAVMAQDESLTYGQLGDQASRIAAALQALEVRPGDRVATMLDANPRHIAAWFGCGWAGAIEVPVNTDYKGAFLEHVLAESGAKVLVCEDRFLPRLAPISAPDLKHVIVAGSTDVEVSQGVKLHSLADALAHDPVAAVPRSERDLVYVLYTSGTTGTSKGVVHCNRSALWTARVWTDLFEVSEDDVGYTFFPLYHVTARSALVMPMILAGAGIAMRPTFSAKEFWTDVRRFGATCTVYMGAVITFLHKQEPQPDDLDNPLRVAGGAAAPPEIADDFERRFGCTLIEVYGGTEIGTASAHRMGEVVRGTVGRPLGHLQIEIHDEGDNPLPPGQPGEICVRPNEPYAIMQGYWNRPEATVEAWRNLWFHTGDLGKLTEDGDLIFLDRIKDSMRRRGENISSFEVERAVQRHEAVLECAAYPIASPATEDDVMTAVVLREGATVSAEELFQFCIATMPRFAVPRYVRFVDDLPRTPTNRVEKYKLRAEGVTDDTYDREAMSIVIARQ